MKRLIFMLFLVFSMLPFSQFNLNFVSEVKAAESEELRASKWNKLLKLNLEGVRKRVLSDHHYVWSEAIVDYDWLRHSSTNEEIRQKFIPMLLARLECIIMRNEPNGANSQLFQHLSRLNNQKRFKDSYQEDLERESASVCRDAQALKKKVEKLLKK